MRPSSSVVLVVLAMAAVLSCADLASAFSYIGGKPYKGMSPSFAVGPHGTPVAAFFNPVSEALEFAMCMDFNCEKGVETIALVRNVANVRAAMALDPKGNPLVAFTDDTNSLRVLTCADIDCEGDLAVVTIATTGGTPVSSPAVALSASNLPLVAFEDHDAGHLQIALCATSPCADGNITIQPISSTVATHPAILVTRARPLVFFFSPETRCIQAAHCADNDCTSIATTVDIRCGDVTPHFSVAKGVDSNPVISLYDSAAKNLVVAKCRDPSCKSTLQTVIDRVGDVGSSSAILSPFDGKPIIFYADDSLATVKIARCADIRCRDGAEDIHVLANAARHGVGFSAAIGVDGIPIVLYVDEEMGEILTLKCLAATCSDAFVTQRIPATAPMGYNPSITTSNGLVGIAGTSDVAGDLNVAYCLNEDCSPASVTSRLVDVTARFTSASKLAHGGLVIAFYEAATATVVLAVCRSKDCKAFHRVEVERGIEVDTPTSVRVDTSGVLVVAYYDKTNGRLRIARCHRTDCSTGVVVNTIDSGLDVGRYPSLDFHAPESPIISYQDTAAGSLRLASCNTPACSEGTVVRVRVDESGNVGTHSSVVVTAQKEVLVSYISKRTGSLNVAFCATVECDEPTISTLDKAGLTGQRTSMALLPSGNAVIAYRDDGSAMLKVATCLNRRCTEASVEVVDSTPGAGARPIITVSGDSGLLVTHFNSRLNTLHAISCNLTNCASTIVDAVLASNVDSHFAAGCRSCSTPAVVYNDVATGVLTTSRCTDSQCWSPLITATIETVVTEPKAAAISGGMYIASSTPEKTRVLVHKCVGTVCSRVAYIEPATNAAIATDAEGIATLVYLDPVTKTLNVARCSDSLCTQHTSRIVATGIDSTKYASIAIESSSSSSNPIVAYHKESSCKLFLAFCSDVTCTGAKRLVLLDQDCRVGTHTTLAFMSGGLPTVSYFDAARSRMKTASCKSADCSGTITVSPVVSLTSDAGGSGLAMRAASDAVSKPVLAAIGTQSTGILVGACEGALCDATTNYIYTVPETSGAVGGIAVAASGSAVLIAHHNKASRSLVVTAVECPPGTFLSQTPHRCLPCAPGTYSDTRAQTSCKECPADNYSPAGSDRCFECVAVPPAWTKQCEAPTPTKTPCKSHYQDGRYLECMSADELYAFTYDHILEGKNTTCMRFERKFSGFAFESTDDVEGFTARRCFEAGGCNCTQIIPCDKTMQNCQRAYRCNSVNGKRNCISPIPCKKTPQVGDQVQVAFDIEGEAPLAQLPTYKKSKLYSSIRRQISEECAIPVCKVSELEVVDDDSVHFRTQDKQTHDDFKTCLARGISFSANVFGAAYPYVAGENL